MHGGGGRDPGGGGRDRGGGGGMDCGRGGGGGVTDRGGGGTDRSGGRDRGGGGGGGTDFGRGGGGGGADRSGGDGGGDRRGRSKPFVGVKFKLMGFEWKVEQQLKNDLENGGGVDARFFGQGSKCTHFIVCSRRVQYDHVWCIEARNIGISVINEIWVRDSLRHAELCDMNKPMYKPKRELGGITGSENLTICCEGYSDDDSEEIEGIVNLIGAQFYPAFTSQATHFLSYKFDGPGYETAKKKGVSIVNKRWLNHCVNQWTFLPVDINIPSDWSLDLQDEQQSTAQRSSQFNSGLTWLEGESSISRSCERDWYPKKQFSTPPPMLSSLQVNNRKCYSTGAKELSQGNADIPSKCKKSLESSFICPDDITLHDYGSKRSKLVQFVLYPCSLLQGIEMTEPFIKSILLKCYVRLVQQKLKNKSLSGNFSAKNFLISEVTGTVELHNVEQQASSDTAIQADKDAFIQMVQRLFDNKVPIDVSVWLECINAGWNDNLICHHINMVQPNSAFGEFQSLFHLLGNMEKFHYYKFNILLTSTPLQDYNNWNQDYTFIWHPLEQNKDYYDFQKGKKNWYYPDAQGLLKNIRDVFEHPGKAYTDSFLDIVLGEMPYLLSDLQKALHDLDFLNHLDVKYSG